MRIFLTILITSISFLSYGQENVIKSIVIEWDQLSAPLSLTKEERNINKYKLLEIDLSINLREQYIRKNTAPMMYLPKNKFVASTYNVTIPQPKTSSIGFTVSSSSYNFKSNNSGGIKNTAYKDANPFRRTFSPITRTTY